MLRIFPFGFLLVENFNYKKAKAFLLFIPNTSSADEEMWLPMFLKRLNISDMEAKGLNLTAD